MDNEYYKSVLLNQSNSYGKVSSYLMPFIPKRLYKYGNFHNEHWEDLIFKGKTYLSKASDFNDPFDCLVNYDFFKLVNSPNIRKRLKENFLLTDKDLIKINQNEIIQKIRYSFQEEIRVACFSEEWHSLLMWSHYADSHKGFCIEYDTENMSEYKKSRLFAAVYLETQIDGTDDLINEHPNAGLISMIGKAKEWSYEKEWRMLDFDSYSEEYRYLKKDIKAVILGVRSDDTNKSKVINWAKNNNKEIYQAKISPMKYEIIKERLV